MSGGGFDPEIMAAVSELSYVEAGLGPDRQVGDSERASIVAKFLAGGAVLTGRFRGGDMFLRRDVWDENLG